VMVVGVAESGLISLKKRKPEEEEAGVAATVYNSSRAAEAA